MKTKIIATLFIMGVVSAFTVRAQESGATQNADDNRVPLTEQPIAFDATRQRALTARLVTPTTELNGTANAPVRNVRFRMLNLTTTTYVYASGWITFYDAEGLRCGAGQWTVSALTPNEAIETDVPGMRLTCTPVTWRIEATNLIAPSNATTISAGRSSLQNNGGTAIGNLSVPDESSIVVSIPREGEIYIGRERVETADLVARINSLMEGRTEPRRVVYINADSNVRYDTVIEVFDALRNASDYQIELVGRKGHTVRPPSNPTP